MGGNFMKSILVLYDKDKLGMTDFAPTDYDALNERVSEECQGKYPNFGNKVWLQGLVSEISTDDVQYNLAYTSIIPQQINEKFDAVILPMANIFHKGWIPWLKIRAKYIRQLKVPVYVIACGVQMESYSDLTQLIKDVENPAREFIDSVYATGGEFGLRGRITEEFFQKLGYHTAVVTGCPSMFQMGRNLHIDNTKKNRTEFKAAINGQIKKLGLNHKSIEEADYIDQGNFGHLLYDIKYSKENPVNSQAIRKLIRRYGYAFVKSLANDKIKLFVDLQQWMSYYVNNNISFSYGSRIHGTIMPILSGVPSMLCPCDARTLEMAEYFDIPMIRGGDNVDIYDLYLKADYTAFNENYNKRYDIFEKFFISHGLLKKINEKNIFICRENKIKFPHNLNMEYTLAIKQQIQNKNLLYKLYEYYIKLRTND